MSTVEERLGALKMEEIAESVRSIAGLTTYDYRPQLPESIRLLFPHICEDCHATYGRFKFAIAAVLKPKRIYEVGVGWGASARSFLAACPDADYFGIDTEEMGVPGDVALSGLRAEYLKVDSQNLDRFVHPHGAIDLIHIDGPHGRHQKSRDIQLALASGAEWLLADDAHDRMVAAGIFDAFYAYWTGGIIQMAYFNNSHTGSLLFHINRR